MTGSGAVFDLGYQPHDGPRLGRGAAVRTTLRDGIRRVFGIRRKARRKVLPFVLLGVALIPAVVMVGLSFFMSQLGMSQGDFGSALDYFGWTGNLMILFCALAAPELLIPDRNDGVLSVYSSRPLTTGDYLGARAAALAVSLGAFMMLPQLLMWVAFAAMEEGGLGGNLIGGLGDLGRSALTVVAYVLGLGAPAFLISAYVRRLSAAAGTYLGGMIGLNVAANALVEDFPLAGVLALAEHPLAVGDWLFDQGMTLTTTRAGLDPWVSALVIAVLAAVTAWLTVRRYRRLM